ncbi:MAG: hypothetical protein NTY30_04045 [Candidatus Berkelbacteria bacterium]|nr:hypothetical protein [Candidatus Berkelbacteria bacterium]
MMAEPGFSAGKAGMDPVEPVPDVETENDEVGPTAIIVGYIRSVPEPALPYAKEMARVTHAKEVTEHFLHTDFQSDENPQLKSVISGGFPMLEGRYLSVHNEIMRAGNNQVLELASGINTRGLHLTKPELVGGRNFNVCCTDLPKMSKYGRMKAEEVLAGEKRENLRYTPASATSAEQLRAAYDQSGFSGPVTIANEGLLMYFDDDGVRKIGKAVHGILSESGGVWTTPDISIGESRIAQLLKHPDENVRKMIQNFIDIFGLNPDSYFKTEEDARDFYDSMGFSMDLKTREYLIDSLGCMKDKKLGLDRDRVIQSLQSQYIATLSPR